MSSFALLLRGLPNSGKTTTAALLRNALKPSVRISNDSVRYMAQPGISATSLSSPPSSAAWISPPHTWRAASYP